MPATRSPARTFGATLPQPQTAPQRLPDFADSNTGRGCKSPSRQWAGSAEPPSKPPQPNAPFRPRIRPTPVASSPPAARRWKSDAKEKQPRAMADEQPEPKRQSDLDTTYARHARQRTPHSRETSWDSGSSERPEGRFPSLPHKDDSHESEAQRRSRPTGL